MKKYIIRASLVVIAIIVIYCLIPKWEYFIDNPGSVVMYRYNKITGKIVAFDSEYLWDDYVERGSKDRY